jgi:uncharacterized protein
MNWTEVDKQVQELTQKCDAKVDIIVAIVRGGLVPARLLAKYLKIEEMYCLTIVKEGNDRHILSNITVELTGKNILLVEDFLESGKSLIAAKQYLEGLGATVKTASLSYQPSALVKPDYSNGEQATIPQFPWD